VLTAVSPNVTGATRVTGKLACEEEYRNINRNEKEEAFLD
jgi:hypothetical protein